MVIDRFPFLGPFRDPIVVFNISVVYIATEMFLFIMFFECLFKFIFWMSFWEVFYVLSQPMLDLFIVSQKEPDYF